MTNQASRVTVAIVAAAALVMASGERARADVPAVCEPPVTLIVLDRSSSMTGPVTGSEGERKWEAARGALDTMLLAYDQSIAFGLMTFPFPDACGPGRLEVRPGIGQRGAIGMALVQPPPTLGNWTPLGETLYAAGDPAQLGGIVPDYVVVITDGFQWCSPYDPAQRELPRTAVKALRDRGIRTFVVGFGGGVDEEALAAMAMIGDTAPVGCDASAQDPARPCYHQADDGPGLATALMAIAARASSEQCNGRDDDCDGTVDDGAPCPSGQACTDGACEVEPAVDAGVAMGADAGLDDDGAPAGCGCTSSDGSAGAAMGALGVALIALAGQRRRRRSGAISASPSSAARPAEPADDVAQPPLTSDGLSPASALPEEPPSGPVGPPSTMGAVAEMITSTHAK